MSDLISRQAAIDAVTDGMCSGWDCEVVDRLKRLPSAERKGKWMDEKNSPFYCSGCGRYQYNSTLEIMSGEWHYCPNCGAKMEGD